jgi:hypothetical protein
MGNAEAISYFAYGWKFWLDVLVGWQRTLDPQLPNVSTDLGTPRRYKFWRNLRKEVASAYFTNYLIHPSSYRWFLIVGFLTPTSLPNLTKQLRSVAVGLVFNSAFYLSFTKIDVRSYLPNSVFHVRPLRILLKIKIPAGTSFPVLPVC